MAAYMLILIFAVNTVNSVVTTEEYKGERFPEKYFEVDDYNPEAKDLNVYLRALYKISDYIALEPNETDINTAFGSFLALGVLKRAAYDDAAKLSHYQKDLLKRIIDNYDKYIVHYIYKRTFEYYPYLSVKADMNYQIAQWMRDADIVAHSLPIFNRNRLKPLLLSNKTTNMNNYTEDMDSATLPRPIYAGLVDLSGTSKHYHVFINVSDYCLSIVKKNIQPALKDFSLRPCVPNSICKEGLKKAPSIAYSLSHRLIDIIVFRFSRRCYLLSPEKDERLLETLAANMYREAVYVAKKGFFARDMFMEHVGTAGMMGYEEFYRRNWFHKVASWVDSEGCIHENRNFCRYSYSAMKNSRSYSPSRRWYRTKLGTKCETHLAAVATVFLANAVRHAAHYVAKKI